MTSQRVMSRKTACREDNTTCQRLRTRRNESYRLVRHFVFRSRTSRHTIPSVRKRKLGGGTSLAQSECGARRGAERGAGGGDVEGKAIA